MEMMDAPDILRLFTWMKMTTGLWIYDLQILEEAIPRSMKTSQRLQQITRPRSQGACASFEVLRQPGTKPTVFATDLLDYQQMTGWRMFLTFLGMTNINNLLRIPARLTRTTSCLSKGEYATKTMRIQHYRRRSGTLLSAYHSGCRSARGYTRLLRPCMNWVVKAYIIVEVVTRDQQPVAEWHRRHVSGHSCLDHKTFEYVLGRIRGTCYHFVCGGESDQIDAALHGFQHVPASFISRWVQLIGDYAS